MLLGEQLIAFRDTSGTVGVIANLCPHRGASLFYGRNEENGIRCVYHGWKFDTTGNCVDMPNEPAESNFKSRVTATAYPTNERGGIVWVYMGRRDTPPELPDFEANQLADGSCSMVMRECNWLQALEGDIDTAHFGFLHLGSVQPEDTVPGTMNHYAVKTRSPKYSVADTDFGAMYSAYRPAEEGHTYWRTGQFLFPFYTHIPTGVMGREIRTRAWVPLDDHHTMFVWMAPGVRSEIPEGGDPERRYYSGSALQPDSSDWFGRYRYVPDATNDYLIDRDAQRTNVSYTGIESVPLQDQAVTESMGHVLNRELEHLGTSDLMVIKVRNLLRDAAIAYAEHKMVPPGVDNPEVYRVRSGGVILPDGVEWLEGIEDLLPAFVDNPPIDESGHPDKYA
jgi:phenylpropionate dioxygenase-like ring-hydroxylating dioxygenase large terminal subunit